MEHVNTEKGQKFVVSYVLLAYRYFYFQINNYLNRNGRIGATNDSQNGTRTVELESWLARTWPPIDTAFIPRHKFIYQATRMS